MRKIKETTNAHKYCILEHCHITISKIGFPRLCERIHTYILSLYSYGKYLFPAGKGRHTIFFSDRTTMVVKPPRSPCAIVFNVTFFFTIFFNAWKWSKNHKKYIKEFQSNLF